ncbi:hypothetical protein RUM44_009793 [Polyplax serrata]|uniref:Uncharacterized protein n=1 Tax=Polyplax serrata TaxID=468196 RepID=A0ABR1ATQ3_POLSC
MKCNPIFAVTLFIVIQSGISNDDLDDGYDSVQGYLNSLLEDEEDDVKKLNHSVLHPSVHEPPGHHEIIAGVELASPVTEYLSEVHKIWQPFKAVHNKMYWTLLDLKRKKQWVENLIRIHQHNEKTRSTNSGYYLRANHLSDLNIREYIRRMLRVTKSHRDSSEPSKYSTTYVKRQLNVPEEWNWLEQGFFTPAWDQANCGSCYAFSIAASAQGQYFRKTRQLRNLSVQQIVDCSVFNGNLGCYGGSLRNALKYCTNAGGLMSADEYPYAARQKLCKYRPWHKSVNVTSYVILPEYDEEAIQEAVATVGPVACSVDASPYTFQLYHKGIYDDPNCSHHKVNHAMLIVGYTKDAWILKNWWGEHWGIDGYMYLKKGVNQCAIAKYAGYPIVDDDNSSEEDVAEESLPIWK